MDCSRLLDQIACAFCFCLRSGSCKLLWLAKSGFCGEPFKAGRGVTEEIHSLQQFSTSRLLLSSATGSHKLAKAVKAPEMISYTDGGLISARKTEWLQIALAVLMNHFKRVGFQTNTSKTKTMTCLPGYTRSPLSTPSLSRPTTAFPTSLTPSANLNFSALIFIEPCRQPANRGRAHSPNTPSLVNNVTTQNLVTKTPLLRL